MTGKIKLTQEVADLIEKLQETRSKENILNLHANPFPWDGRYAERLNEMSQADLAKALLIGYEVEPTFKVGDWVYEVNGKRVSKIVRVGNDFVETETLSTPGKDYIRHATPKEIAQEKERRKWAEIKEGDVLRMIPMAHDIGIYEGEGDSQSILVRNESGQHLWKKCQVELYAKKVGGNQ